MEDAGGTRGDFSEGAVVYWPCGNAQPGHEAAFAGGADHVASVLAVEAEHVGDRGDLHGAGSEQPDPAVVRHDGAVIEAEDAVGLGGVVGQVEKAAAEDHGEAGDEGEGVEGAGVGDVERVEGGKVFAEEVGTVPGFGGVDDEADIGGAVEVVRADLQLVGEPGVVLIAKGDEVAGAEGSGAEEVVGIAEALRVFVDADGEGAWAAKRSRRARVPSSVTTSSRGRRVCCARLSNCSRRCFSPL